MIYLSLGDSHASAFSGLEGMVDGYPHIHRNGKFVSSRLGAITAYNTFKREEIIAKTMSESDFDKNVDKLIVVVGEIDCRWHIPRIAKRDNITISTSINNTIEKLMGALRKFGDQGIKVMSYGSIGSSCLPENLSEGDPNNFPRFGDVIFRNKITLEYNDKLYLESYKYGIENLDISQHLIKDDLTTNMDYYMDAIHLNSKKIMPFIIERLGQ